MRITTSEDFLQVKPFKEVEKGEAFLLVDDNNTLYIKVEPCIVKNRSEEDEEIYYCEALDLRTGYLYPVNEDEKAQIVSAKVVVGL